MSITQNIDGLERKLGVSSVVELHGTNATSHCIDCSAEFFGMRWYINNGEVAICKECGGYAKPDVIFFGEMLKVNMWEVKNDLLNSDLVMILGTSLSVFPAASLVNYVSEKAKVVYINKEAPVDSKMGWVVLEGDCDEVIKDACEGLGWMEELERIKKDYSPVNGLINNSSENDL